MSGHNKWSQIKHKKGLTDVKRSKLFSVLTKNIQMEAKKTRGDRNSAALRVAIERARASNLPNKNIERAIRSATDAKGLSVETVRYEAYGPEGAAIIIEAITDNKNRAAQEIKHLLSENSAVLAAPGSAIWAFEPPISGETNWKPKINRAVSSESAAALSTLIEKLEARDDVQTVSTDVNLKPLKKV